MSMNLRVVTERAAALGVDGHVCELQLVLLRFAERKARTRAHAQAHTRARARAHTHTHTHTHTQLVHTRTHTHTHELQLVLARFAERKVPRAFIRRLSPLSSPAARFPASTSPPPPR